MITLYQYEISPYADKVRRVLHVKGLEYRVVEIRPSKRKQARAISPTGKFPAIDTPEGERVIDSTDIFHWAERYRPDPSLLPDAAADRARAHILEDWADESLYFYDLTLRSHWPHNWPLLNEDILRYETGFTRWLLFRLQAIPKALDRVAKGQGIGRKDDETLKRETASHFDAISALVADGGWLVGAQMTIADLAVFAMVYVIRRAREGEALYQDRAALQDWFDRVDRATAGPSNVQRSLL